jgi:hypothetical protein
MNYYRKSNVRMVYVYNTGFKALHDMTLNRKEIRNKEEGVRCITLHKLSNV